MAESMSALARDTRQSIYSTDFNVQWLRFVCFFIFTGELYSSLKKQHQEMTHDSNSGACEF